MIKLFGYLLMTIGLIGGSLGAITAYRPLVSMPDSELVGLTLSSGAGRDPADPEAPMFAKGTVLTAEDLAALRAGDPEERLVVKEFAFRRWDMAWAACASVGVLALGACIVKFEVRRRIRAAAADSATDTTKGPTPESALATIMSSLEKLRAEIAGIADPHQRNARIIEVIGELNLVQVAAIVDQRHVIMGRQGLGGMAAFMDRFASAERAMNRAWSAAADSANDEAELCLTRAIEILPEAQKLLRGV